MTATRTARYVLSGSAGMVCVGGGVGVSHALTSAPLFTAQAIRYAIATVLLAALARAAGARIVRPRGWDWFWLCSVAVVGMVTFNVAIVRGVAHAEPAVIAVAVAGVPIVLGVLGPLFAGDRPRHRIVLAAVVVTAGSVLVEGTGHADAIGIGWAALTLACEAGFTLLAVPALARHSAWSVSLHAMWLATVMLAVLGVSVEGPTAVLRLHTAGWGAIGYLAVMSSAAAFVLWFTAVSHLGAHRAGLLTGIAPISAALSGIAISGDVPGSFVWAGMIVVGAGLVIGLSRQSVRDPGIHRVRCVESEANIGRNRRFRVGLAAVNTDRNL